MSFNTHGGSVGKTAVLESRILYPKRTEQCLQFFYKMDGSPKDKLTIWVRLDDGTGNVRRMRKIKSINGIYFILHYFLPRGAKEDLGRVHKATYLG